MTLEIKICGLKTEEAVDAALAAGADLIGFVFFAKSPRNVTLDEAVRLAAPARGRSGVVALIVDADDAALTAIARELRPDLIQLHGRESPARCAAIRALTGRPVMKALAIAEAADLDPLPAYAAVCDRILLDAKPPGTPDALPGGNGLSFDWRLVRDLDPGRPVMLSGGLTPETVAEAIAVAGVAAVDVSSGVERAPGRKDPARIHAFIDNAREADRRRTTEPGPKP